MKNRAIVLILICVSTVAAAADGYLWPPTGRHILPVRLGKPLLNPCSRPAPKAVSDFWEPTGAEIDNLEKRLVIYMGALEQAGSLRPPAGAYDRQYIGIVVKGARLIYGNFYPPGYSEDRQSRWPITVCDGGPALWGVVFDPKFNAFTELELTGGG
jgi:hypothetical protein